MIEPDGSKYEGNWKNDMRNGKGQFTSVAGAITKGNWADNKFIIL